MEHTTGEPLRSRPKPKPPTQKPWSKAFTGRNRPEINGSDLTYTTSSTRAFVSPVVEAKMQEETAR